MQIFTETPFSLIAAHHTATKLYTYNPGYLLEKNIFLTSLNGKPIWILDFIC